MKIRIKNLGSIAINLIFIIISITAIIKTDFIGLLFSTLSLGYIHLNSGLKTYNNKTKLIKIILLLVGTILCLLLKIKWLFIDKRFIIAYSYIVLYSMSSIE